MVYTPKFTTSQGATGAIRRLLSSLYNPKFIRRYAMNWANGKFTWFRFAYNLIWCRYNCEYAMKLDIYMSHFDSPILLIWNFAKDHKVRKPGKAPCDNMDWIY